MPKDYSGLGIRVSESARFRVAAEQARSTSAPNVVRYVLAILIVLAAAATARAQTCNYYAAPNGTGNGLSTSSPFKVQDFWSRAYPGQTLCLLDGTYSGYPNMILPPQRLSGSSGSPITVRALNDGKVLFNGTYSLPPIQLYFNDWFVIDGVNACCALGNVVDVVESNHNVLRRVAAWDAADGNTEIFGVHGGSFNLLEDIAGWGTARKMVTTSYGGNNTTIRRAWARWERSTVVGPKLAYSLVYNSYGTLCENCIGAWSGQSMPQTYVLRDYNGQPYTGSTGGTYTNYRVEQPMGIFWNEREDNSTAANSRLLGSLAYLLPTDRFAANFTVFSGGSDSVEVKDTVVSIASGTFPYVTPYELLNLSGASNLKATNLTSFGGAPSYIESQWQKSNLFLGGAYGAGENAFNTSRGANLCYRYQDGNLTTQPLWPWPMNQRIADGLQQSGRSPVDVTATVQSLLGTIPAQCYGSGLVSEPPPPPPPPSTPLPSTIVYRSSASASGSAASLTITKPSGVVNGDVLVATIVWTKQGVWSGSITPPAGWVSRVVNTPYSLRMETFTKVASNEGSSYTFNMPFGSGVGAISAFQGVDNASPLDVAAAGRNTTFENPVVAPSLSTVSANAMLVSIFGSQMLDFWTSPAGETGLLSVRDATAASGWYTSVHQAIVQLGAAGTTGTRSATASVAKWDEVGQSIALRPASR